MVERSQNVKQAQVCKAAKIQRICKTVVPKPTNVPLFNQIQSKPYKSEFQLERCQAAKLAR